MTIVDLAVVVFVVASMVHGLWLGAVVQVSAFGGFVGGLLGGAAIAPSVADRVDDPTLVRLVTVAVVFGSAAVAAGLGRALGTRLAGAVRRLRLGSADAVLGAAVAGAAALLVSWMVGSVLATAPEPALAREIQRSTVLRRLDGAFPPAPVVLARVQLLLEQRGLPPTFAGLPPLPSPRMDPPEDLEVRRAADRAGASTVAITALGCGGIHQGSGFAAAADLVVTNAHVIAGAEDVAVTVGGRALSATPVLFDDDLDVAVLRVPDLGVPALAIRRDEVTRGSTGAALGYPLGGPFTAEPAVVLRRLDATGRDLLAQDVVQRPVYEIQSRIQPGNSGGPLVDPAGTVIGLVFSRSAAAADIGYAITSPVVAERVDQAAAAGAVDTGPCAAG